MGLLNYYNYLMEESVDPRTKDWFLVRSPVHISSILLLYYYLVRVGTPDYMRDRKAYSFKTFLQIYNVFQIIVNAYIVYSTVVAGWLNHGFRCEPLDMSVTGDGYNMAVVVWNLYIVKLIDLSETIVFVLRKKFNQVSFLHVYHHISTAFIMWMFVKWHPGGVLGLIMIVNSSVHVIMYTYYLLSTGGPFMKRLSTPIKPWITIIQLTQFVMLFVHALAFMKSSCKTPVAMSVVVISNAIINFWLFYNFYNKSYREKKTPVKSN